MVAIFNPLASPEAKGNIVATLELPYVGKQFLPSALWLMPPCLLLSLSALDADFLS